MTTPPTPGRQPAGPGDLPGLSEGERAALVKQIIARYYARGIQTNETGLTTTAHAAVDVLAARQVAADQRLREALAGFEALAEEWDDPDPERGDPDRADVLRAAIAAALGTKP